MQPTTTTPATTCTATIGREHLIRSERRRGFQPPYYTVYVYRCPTCHAEHTLRASAFRGTQPEPMRGAIRCGR